MTITPTTKIDRTTTLKKLRRQREHQAIPNNDTNTNNIAMRTHSNKYTRNHKNENTTAVEANHLNINISNSNTHRHANTTTNNNFKCKSNVEIQHLFQSTESLTEREECGASRNAFSKVLLSGFLIRIITAASAERAPALRVSTTAHASTGNAAAFAGRADEHKMWVGGVDGGKEDARVWAGGGWKGGS
jgi:hypothetical protein